MIQSSNMTITCVSKQENSSPGPTVSGTFVENVDRFQKQDATEDPTVYGRLRVLEQPLEFTEDARTKFYKKKAIDTIASFEASFGQKKGK
ncbi:hypothetical protein VTH82DRAFT_8366 [Thermothelomyces myriococcoides]